MKIKGSQHKARKRIFLCVIVILLAGAGYATYAHANNLWPFEPAYTPDSPILSVPKKTKPASNEDLQKKIETNQEQSDVSTDGTTIQDTSGRDATAKSGGVSSSSGDITLYTPAGGDRITGNTTVQGSASVANVYYRLKDNIHGVIGQGQLTVKDGRFSGALKVNTSASTGTLEFYSLDAQGREINGVKIDVAY